MGILFLRLTRSTLGVPLLLVGCLLVASLISGLLFYPVFLTMMGTFATIAMLIYLLTAILLRAAIG